MYYSYLSLLSGGLSDRDWITVLAVWEAVFKEQRKKCRHITADYIYECVWRTTWYLFIIILSTPIHPLRFVLQLVVS